MAQLALKTRTADIVFRTYKYRPDLDVNWSDEKLERYMIKKDDIITTRIETPLRVSKYWASRVLDLISKIENPNKRIITVRKSTEKILLSIRCRELLDDIKISKAQQKLDAIQGLFDIAIAKQE